MGALATKDRKDQKDRARYTSATHSVYNMRENSSEARPLGPFGRLCPFGPLWRVRLSFAAIAPALLPCLGLDFVHPQLVFRSCEHLAA